MKKPLVSVLIPTLNSERFIRETLHSLIDQTYERLEFVFVDGGSTDDTLNIIEDYSGDGDGVKIVNASPGGGMGHDLNLGLTHCEGAYIARMDADDVCLPDRFEAQVDFLAVYPMIDLVGGSAELIWNASGMQHPPMWHDNIRDEYLVNNPFFHPTIMIRRKLVDEGIYHYDSTFKADEDYELWGRLIPVITCANMERPLIKYRIHGGNGQREPWKQRHKSLALQRFCRGENIYDADLIDTLSEFQCSQFVTPQMYEIMRNYAVRAEATGVGIDYTKEGAYKAKLPCLGWIHNPLVECKTYGDFMEWFCSAKGWF